MALAGLPPFGVVAPAMGSKPASSHQSAVHFADAALPAEGPIPCWLMVAAAAAARGLGSKPNQLAKAQRMSFVDIFGSDRSSRPHRDAGRGRRRARRHARPYRAQAWPSVGAGGRGRKLGHIGLRVRILAAHSDLGLCPCPREAGGEAIIVVLLNSYLAILALFVWLRFIPFNLFWKLSPPSC